MARSLGRIGERERGMEETGETICDPVRAEEGPQRYFTESGANPELSYQLTIAGPQLADQVPEEVRKLLDRPNVIRVVVFTHYAYPAMTAYRKIREPEAV